MSAQGPQEAKLRPLDLTTILASSIHDMKNNLGLLLQTVETLEEQAEEPLSRRQQHYRDLRLAGLRLNQQMMQMLSLYKLQSHLYTPNVESWMMAEILEEACLEYVPLFAGRGLELDWSCAEELEGFCDRELVSGVIGNALHNALRFARGRVLLSARAWSHARGEGVQILVEDDGPGYAVPAVVSLGEDMASADGSTGLGLHFARLVAETHANHGVHGELHCDNESRFGGARCALRLP